jgi:serine protease AprX
MKNMVRYFLKCNEARPYAILAGLLLLGLVATAQENYYWIKFKDKNCSWDAWSNPSQFLSPASLQRRQIQNIAINESDLPVCEDYIDSISPYISHLKHRLKWFNMAVVQVNVPQNIAQLKAFSFVDSVGPIMQIPQATKTDKFATEFTEPLPDQSIVYPNLYGLGYNQLNMLNGDLLHQLGYRGEGVLMAVFDNGFVNVNIIPGFDSARQKIVGTYDFVSHEENVYDDGGHGTNVLSCIAANVPNRMVGSAPGVNLLLLESEDDNAEWIMEEYNWAAAAEYADSAGAKIFSTSLGYTTFDGDSGNHTYADLNGNKTVITRAGNMAFGKGILVINSAGNYGGNSWRYVGAPADGDSILSIGAVDSAEVIAGFSSRGPTSAGKIKPDVCSQGVKSGVLSTTGDVSTSGGTSFSCPILAGCAACLWQAFPDKTNREIFDAIVISADRFWTPGNDYGYGIPNFYNAYLVLKTDYNANILKINRDAAVYPNPFSNELNVSIFSQDNKTQTIEIFDQSGHCVIKQELFLRDKTFEIVKVPGVANLSAGKYVLRLNHDKATSVKLIKTR